MPDAQLHAAHQVALVEWWDMNTALYYLLAPAFILDGPLMRSDTVFIEQHFVKQQWRDGKGLYNWLMLFGTDDTVKAQQSLQAKVGSASLHASADISQLQSHCDELFSNWSRIAGNDSAKPESYVWRLLTSMPSEPPAAKVVLLRDWLAQRVTDQSAFKCTVSAVLWS